MTMLYRELGNSGLRVSLLSFGSMRWQSEEACHEIIQRGMDLGMNYIDTSTGYVGGQSLKWSGRAVRGRREQILFACKSNWSSAPNESAVRRSIESALRSAELEYFDLYQLWGLRSLHTLKQALAPGGTVEGIRRAQSEGLVRYGAGFTFHGSPDVFRAAIDSGEFLAATVSYNLSKRKEEGLIRYAYEHGVGIIIMNPLAGGVLARKGDKRLHFLAGNGAGPAYGALRFLFANQHISTCLLGLRSIAELEEDIRALKDAESLNETYRSELARQYAAARLAQGNFCTGCGYCADCPQDVGPEKLMPLLRDYQIASGGVTLAEWLRAAYMPENPLERLARCIACGQCEANCPQQLPIMDEIDRAREALRNR